MNLFARSSLVIYPDERIVYLYPRGRADGSSRGTVVEGHVTLSLSKATQVKHLTVQLLSTATVRSAQRESSGTLMDMKSVIAVDAKLEAGDWDFAWVFTLEATSAFSARPSIGHGVISHKILASASTGGLLGDIHASEASFYVISVPTEDGNRIPPLDIYLEEQTPGLGPISMLWQCPSFTQACVFLSELRVIAPEAPLKILNASIWLSEHITLRHFDRHGQPEDDTTRNTNEQCVSRISGKLSEHTKLFLGETEVAQPELPLAVQKGQSFSFKHYARMPISILHQNRNVPVCRYSTPPECNSPINISHELTLKVNFQTGGKTLQMTVQRPISIASCLLLDSNTFPPDYDHQVGTSPFSENGTEMRRITSRSILSNDWGSRDEERCICMLTFDDCMADFARETDPATAQSARVNYKVV